MSTQDTQDCSDGCAQALERLQSFLDGELPDTEVHAIRRHLDACYPCTSRASFEEQLRAIVRDGCIEQAPPELIERIRVRLRDGGAS